MSFRLNLNDCKAALGAKLVGDSVTVTGVSIDSRTVRPGELYIAIVGERFDGHEFIEAAQAAGAAAVMVHEEINCKLPQLRVANTLNALGQLGKLWAARFAIPTIAITGSNGKTTVKEIVSSILRQQGPVLATRGNLNNELGVPLTLLNMRKEHDYAVVEMGANHAGEIARLVALAEPDVCVVTNIGCAHLEGFGSVQGIADAKSEIYAGLKSDGYGVINLDDVFAERMQAACAHCQTRTFGYDQDADVCGVPSQELVIQSMGRTISPRFRLAGKHNAMNAMAAVAAVQCLDVRHESLVKGLEGVLPVPGRLEKKFGTLGATVIDDSYNANPDSVRSAIKVLAAYSGKRYLVLGDMGELGADELTLHGSIGQFASEQGIDGLWVTGKLSAQTQKVFADATPTTMAAKSAHFESKELLIENLLTYLDDDVTVLVKGSRSAQMENVVNALLASGTQGLAKEPTGATS